MLREQSAVGAAAGTAAKPDTKFPKTVAAVREWEVAHRQGENGRWKIGDALLVECGRPGEHGVNTGVEKLLKKASAELTARFGKRYHWKYLKHPRSVASKFTQEAVRTASWSACSYAGDPKTLKAAQKKAREDGEDFDVDYIRKYKSLLARQKHQCKRQREPEYVTPRDEFFRATYDAISRGNAYKKRLEINRVLISPVELAATNKKINEVQNKINAIFVAIERELTSSSKAPA
jgi:hypothetical protein